MPQVSRSADVPFPAPDMFNLVADIERYPRFLPWCRSATVHARTSTVVTASLEIARGPFRKSFTTRNRMVDPERIDIELVDGPFSHLDGCWSFDAMAAQSCKVGFEMRFEISNRMLARVLAPLFEEIARTMLDAFCRRAFQVYGSR
jgi:ribosome-associated toxin RatA of RatAB toxin-antitoxin module